MWLPRVDEQQPNPWFDVLNFVPTCHELGARPFPFTHLPVELGQRIAFILPKESAAALSVTSRAMHRLVPRQFFRDMSIPERWRLTLLLERDSEFLVACQLCLKLHGPFRRTDVPCQTQWQLLLPAGITPALCRQLARCYIRQKNYSDLLCLAGRTKTYTIPDFKVFSNSTLRMTDGKLFVRQETFIAPLTAHGDLTSQSGYLFDHLINGSNCQVCPHVRWRHLGVDLSYNPNPDIDRHSSLSASYLSIQLRNRSYLRNQLYGKDSLKDQLFELDHGRRDLFNDYRSTVCNESVCGSENFWPNRHTHQCYDSKPVPRAILNTALSPCLVCAFFHHQPCRKPECNSMAGRFRVNLVRACEICATDMCVSAQDVVGVGRVVGLTTWKCLGGVYDKQWADWYPHSANVGRFTRDFIVRSQAGTITRDLRKGTIVYAGFENAPTTEGAAWYTASLTGRILAALARQPSVEELQWIRGVSMLDLNVV